MGGVRASSIALNSGLPPPFPWAPPGQRTPSGAEAHPSDLADRAPCGGRPIRAVM